ncbi:AhpC/TSA family protein [Haloprofundus marisrubri]|uniref:AhpC/TSA family protein n=1 Tax=Haloprofundus marisrubri TaxID=1514971 RepID=A0A0W1R3Y8_9EURY|nr:redoxin domain-containing protein [Haloprofundus marisrubri]KTG08128.1 AhpC/TSA family protein [Haloprofundus marisrubri]
MPEFDVVDLPETDHVDVGDTAPDFTRPLVNAEYWEDVSLSELTDDGPVLLVFYTMDGAFPATYMWNEIRDRSWGEKLTVVGLSISSAYEHKTLIEERGMEYSLFSDPQNGVAADYGVENDLDGMAGVSEARPAVFLLDGDRTVEYAWVASEWPDFPDYDEVEAAIDDLV